MNRKLATFACGLMASSFLATPAFAQDDEADDGVLPDDNVIIVTATLRAADVQDIPIAVTAVQPEQLERQGISDIKSLSSISPSFNIQSSQTETQGTSIKIRGVGTTGNNTGLESSVGVFIDGVYQSAPASRWATSWTSSGSKCCAARRARCSVATPRLVRSTLPPSVRASTSSKVSPTPPMAITTL